MIPAYYVMVLVAVCWLLLVWAGARMRGRGCTRRVNLAFGMAAVLVLFLPFNGLRLWSWVFGFCPNPSFPLLGLVCAGLWQRLFGIEVLKPADWRASWVFGALVGSVLYLHPMVVGALDLYYWGWELTISSTVLAGVAIAFLALGNRLGVLLLAALVGYSLRALESQNCWDYVVDPLYWIASVFVVLGRLATRGLAWRAAHHRGAKAAAAQ